MISNSDSDGRDLLQRTAQIINQSKLTIKVFQRPFNFPLLLVLQQNFAFIQLAYLH